MDKNIGDHGLSDYDGRLDRSRGVGRGVTQAPAYLKLLERFA